MVAGGHLSAIFWSALEAALALAVSNTETSGDVSSTWVSGGTVLETASLSWVWGRWGGTMVEASVVEASFLLAAESTKGGITAEEWFSWGIVAGSSMWVVRRVGAPDDVL